jgi:hypothetical protein
MSEEEEKSVDGERKRRKRRSGRRRRKEGEKRERREGEEDGIRTLILIKAPDLPCSKTDLAFRKITPSPLSCKICCRTFAT